MVATTAAAPSGPAASLRCDAIAQNTFRWLLFAAAAAAKSSSQSAARNKVVGRSAGMPSAPAMVRRRIAAATALGQPSQMMPTGMSRSRIARHTAPMPGRTRRLLAAGPRRRALAAVVRAASSCRVASGTRARSGAAAAIRPPTMSAAEDPEAEDPATEAVEAGARVTEFARRKMSCQVASEMLTDRRRRSARARSHARRWKASRFSTMAGRVRRSAEEEAIMAERPAAELEVNRDKKEYKKREGAGGIKILLAFYFSFSVGFSF